MKLEKSYLPQDYEANIYALWEKSKAFAPQGNGKPFSIVIPPPNANGNLHMGHALTFAIEDIMARYHRTLGERVLFVPGADHAGFETQVVYERKLEKEGKSRFDYSREQLYANIYSFVEQNKENFQSQIRRLGASVDWGHYTFSLDPQIISRAYATFRSMFDDGLIYRGERLVNFCTFHGTAFADIEVEYKEEQGKLWQIRYPLTDSSGQITVATTRPETMLGDTAVAVNPKDPRYKGLVGKTVKLPLTNREIPIIADDYVDPQFGTGAVKITPAHDPNDYEVAKRHDLPFVTVIGFDGNLTHDVPELFRGLPVNKGREAVVEALRSQGYLVDSEDYSHSVGHCYKCGTVIEPLLKDQWFIDIKPLTKKALDAIKDGKISFMPRSKQTQLVRYLENIRDWNISRQNAWGIPIPAFQNEEDPDDWIFDDRVKQEVIEVNNKVYRRDPDVFDTWFSSSSWPYATLGYPDSQDYKEFYPLSVMESGFDLIMPWISRMIMFGLYVTGDVPFRDVYLHGMITDEHGKKMSKSIGNVINPMDVIDEYGSDALRIGVLSGHTPGNNQPYVVSKVVGGRNFCNKLWNIARFIEGKLEVNDTSDGTPQSDADHWILQRYETTRDDYIKLMSSYRFSEAYELTYHFIWDDVADWYIETSKSEANSKFMVSLLKASLVLVHPFVPFLSETIWQTLELEPNSLLSSQHLIDLEKADKGRAHRFEIIKDLISATRSLLIATGAKDVKLYYHEEPIVDLFATLIKQLTGVVAVEEGEPEQGIGVTGTNLNAWLDISQDQIDSYLGRLDQQLNAEQKRLKQLQARLDNSAYTSRAPENLVNETREQLIESEQSLENLLQEKLRFSKP